MDDKVLVIKYKRLVEEVVEVPIYDEGIIENLDKIDDDLMLEVVQECAFDESLTDQRLVRARYLNHELITQDEWYEKQKMNDDKEQIFWDNLLMNIAKNE